MVDDQAVRGTSDWMAAIRYLESQRQDAFLVDPWASALAGDYAEVTARLAALGAPSEVVITRGRLGDAVVMAAVAEGVDQVVILAAGSDTRSFRLDLPAQVTLFELDLPGQLAGKLETLRRAGAAHDSRLVVVEADLREDWTAALAAAGFAAHRPAVWLIEGLFYYLDRHAGDSVLKQLSSASARGSWLALDIPHERFLTEPANAPFLEYMAERGSPFVGALPDPVRWLAGNGWQARAYLAEDLVAGDCPLIPPPPARLSNPDHPIWHVVAQRL
ncbi:MAG TPA: SAM-dependent methyltransferase [Micromonosporaceae bacterium]|nr:SAM-dependent methyltransferase [Micromonosporaceae bacterium]